MINYKGRKNIEIINEYIYLINSLFLGKEVVVESLNGRPYCSIWMGVNESSIELPVSAINGIINNSGIFVQDSGTLSRSVHVLREREELKDWCRQQSNNYLLNSPGVENFEPAIRQMKRINNLKTLLYNK